MRPVVLVSLDWVRPHDPRTGLGVASIASALKAADVDVTVVGDAVNRAAFDADAFIQRVIAVTAAAGPDALCGIAAFVWNEPEVVRLLGALRATVPNPVVLGGPQVSYAGRGTLEGLYDADFFVRGHGEAAMVALATGGDLAGTGVHRFGTTDLDQRSVIDLSALPSPHLDGTLPIGANVRWETLRGCPYRCTFCQHREPGSKRTPGLLGEDRILAEATAFRDGGVRRISVLDPIFHANRGRAIRLLGGFREVGLRSQLSLQCRFELCDDAFLDALDGLDVVLEFGLQTAIESESSAIERRNKMDTVAAAIDRIHARGIPFEVSLIYGLPLQTLDSFRRSVDWCLDRGVPTLRAWPLMLLRGTPLFDHKARWGFVESVGERIPIVVESATFSRAEHAQMAGLADEVNRIGNNKGVWA